MRVIWWKISRPTTQEDSATVHGETLHIELPEDWQNRLARPEDLDRDWLDRLLHWDHQPPNRQGP